MTYIKPPASHECKWRSGPPPEVGWWPASFCQEPECLRWWNGVNWSQPVHDESSSEVASINAASPTNISRQLTSIEWTDRWWLKSRKETK